MKTIFKITPILLLIFNLFSTAQAQVNESDSLELVRLYNATGGDNWYNNDGWLVDPVEEWFGITLSGDGTRVIRIKLNSNDGYTSNNLVGELIDLNLPQLTLLDLSINKLTNDIPDFNHLPNLTSLNLSKNQLSGNIPNFTDLFNLQSVELSDNELSASIPNFSNLPKLTHLGLTNNQLSGEIPNFSNLPNLTNLNLSHNELTGTIPDFNLPNLIHLNLYKNDLTGIIPDFNNLSNLTYLILSLNKLTGIIPDFNNLHKLQVLGLHNNQLSDSLPNFSKFDSLYIIGITSNQFTFSGLEENVRDSNIPHLFSLGYDASFSYGYQACIPISKNNNTLSVSAGGTLNNNTYTWFKDGQQIAQIVGDSTLNISGIGTYTCEISNSIVAKLTLHTFPLCLEGCVWPGDTNSDGVVTHRDLLNIGRAYDEIGITRIDQSISWDAKYSEEWDSTFASGVNYKHADCNGDGFINAADTAAILLNYGQVRNKANTSLVAKNGIPLFPVFEETIVDSIEHIFGIHLGDATTPAENVYGIAFTLRSKVANAEIRINEPMLDFSHSWLNEDNGNILTIDSCFSQSTSEWLWDIAITRTNHNSIRGFGEICKVACIMDIISVDGKAKTNNIFLELYIDNVSLIPYKGEEIPVNPQPQSIEILLQNVSTPTSTNENSFSHNANIRLIPNPISANRQLTINYPNQQPILIQLYDIRGKLLLEQQSKEQNQHSLQLPNLAIATYFVKIVDNKLSKQTVQKLIIVN